MPEVQQTFGAVVHVLPVVRRGINADLSRVPQEARAGLGELRVLRLVVDGAGPEFSALGFRVEKH